jgi:hypothetical protein
MNASTNTDAATVGLGERKLLERSRERDSRSDV